MLGHLVIEGRGGRKSSAELERVMGLALLRVTVPLLPGAGEGTVRRRMAGAARLLNRAQIRRVLTGSDFAHRALLRDWGLEEVETASLCQAAASRLALAALARRALLPACTTVALRGGRVSRPFFQAAMELAPKVRALVVAAPNGGAALSGYLREEYGVPVLEEGEYVVPDLTLEFSLLKGGEGEKLLLYGRPDLLGLDICPEEGRWPAAFEPLSLAAALWEAGALSLGEMKFT